MGLEPEVAPVEHPVVFRLSRISDVSFPGAQGIVQHPICEWYPGQEPVGNWLDYHVFVFGLIMEQHNMPRLQFDKDGVSFIIERYRRNDRLKPNT